jgi:hypothetical protein
MRAGMPTASASLQPLRDRAGHVWCAGCAGRTVCTTAAMVIAKGYGFTLLSRLGA